MVEESPLQVVRLTPPGRGAVATLLIEGPGAAALLDDRILAGGGRGLSGRAMARVLVCRLGPGIDEDVVVRRRNQQSVELHCHGGYAAVARIEEVLVRMGCKVVSWQDWAAGRREDPITAAAHLALAEARTERTAAVLLDQYRGALRRALRAIDGAMGRNETPTAKGLIDELLARADFGRHLVRPWRVVLAGHPNVGKSSLINALLGYGRAIVHQTPGTTRDVVTAEAAVDGWPIELAGTAGLRASGNTVERAGVALARATLSRADLAILVFDAAAEWTAADEELVESWPHGLIVHNKADLAPATRPRRPGLATSALTGEGIEAMLRAIADRLVPDAPTPGGAVPFADEQIQHLSDLRAQA